MLSQRSVSPLQARFTPRQAALFTVIATVNKVIVMIDKSPDLSSQLLRSILALRSSIPGDAFTATTLGTRREGSGVVIRENGLVLTIGYLTLEADELWLTSNDGQLVAAHALAYDQETGFGLVQALGNLGLPALQFGDSAKAKVGDPVVLADGAGRFVEANIVAKQEFAGYWEYLLDEAIFTAPAHPWWGGAALIGSDGKLLGIGSLRLEMSRNGDITDINMAVPINLLQPILSDLLRQGQVNKPPRPWLGAFSAESNGKVMVMSVAEGGRLQKPACEKAISSRISEIAKSTVWPIFTARSGRSALREQRSP